MPKAIRKHSPTSWRSARDYRSWVGRKDTISGLIIDGLAANAGRMRAFAREIVELQPDVILARSTPATAALKSETRTIPIVFTTVSDPIGSKFVANLARPGGNITGFTNFESSMGGKWLGLLKEIAPHLTRTGM